MTLGELQRQLPPMVAKLIEYAYANGYELTWGDAYRDPRVHGVHGETRSYSSAYSNHKLRLAIDLNLFIGGHYMTSDDAYGPLHDYWDSLGGAPRIPGDGNHFSLPWEGRR